jgi:TonB-dependent siderophore receptor
MRLILLTITFLFTCSAFAQQHGTIKGVITTSDGKPAANVSVKIENARQGDITNEKGEYMIRRVAPGSRLLKVTAVGAVAQERTLTVEAGKTIAADFILNINASQLEEVVVSSRNPDKENRFVAKMPLTNLENPQVYNTVSAELLKQQAITNFDDALRNVPGISRTWESTGRPGDGGSYFALRGFDAQPMLTNGLPGLSFGNLDPSNIEEIEVLKGPSGTLFGGSVYSYGGMINTVTKKPYYDFGGEVAYNFGSFGLNRITADFNTPLSKTEKIAMRVNMAYHNENSWQDAGFKKSFFVAPSLSYVVNDRLSFQVMTEFLDEERAVPPVFFHSDRYTPLPFKNLSELNLNRELSFTSNELTMKNPRFNMQAQMLYKLSSQWTSQTVVSRSTVKSNGIYTYIWDDDPSTADYFNQYFHRDAFTQSATDIQQNFNGDFMIGKVRNRLLVGLDFYSRTTIDHGSDWVVGRVVTPQGEVITEDPSSGDPIPAVPLTLSAVNALIDQTGYVVNSNVTNSFYSAYVSDVVNILPNLMAMASLRVDHFRSGGEKFIDDEDFDQTLVSPKLGLVYQPIPDRLSLFANYINGFINQEPRQTTNGLKSFKPEHANQLEYGIKANLFGGKLFGTVSVYDIRVRDRVVPLPDDMNDYRQGAKVSSKGFEVDLTSNPVAGLNLIAGYSYNDIQSLAGTFNDFYSEPGRSPGGQGPKNLANFWATYKFLKGGLKNFGIGVGGNWASEYRVIDNSATGNFDLPSYTLVNASLFYNGEKVRVTCNVNNLNDEEYYIGYWSVNPQKGRNFVMSVAYKF